MSIELTPQLRDRIENTIRFMAVDAIQRANSGHPGAPMALAGAVFELFDNHLRFDPEDPEWPLRDRFILSNGHASMLLYSMLHLYGYDLPIEEIERFRQIGAKTAGHPEYGEIPGVEVTTGPLGQGISHAVGMALAARMTRAQFGSPGDEGSPGGHFVYGVAGDGDLMEGVSSEASSLAGHLGLGNLVFIYDDNKITIDGGTEVSFTEDVKKRYEAYGWHVIDEVDGQDISGLRVALERGRSEFERPTLIMLRTVIGYGSPNRAGTSGVHGSALGREEVELSKQAMGWPLEPELFVPDEVRAYFAERIVAKQDARKATDEKTAAWRRAQPEISSAWDAARSRKMPEGLLATLAEGMDGVVSPTRKHSATVLQKLSELVPYMAGGSADLAGSAAPPIIKGVGMVESSRTGADQAFAGRNIHFGVREHAMGSIQNGMALDGTFIPYSGTFLIFSDYMRPAIRLASLMKLRTIYVFTHDSIFLGEDGPTHQPVEQLDSLRAVPGLTVFRPADGVETAAAYAWALEESAGPTLLSLTRQDTAVLERPKDFALEHIYKGGYCVQEPDGTLDAVLLATGSEVGLACETARKLTGDGLQIRVVSVPSMELLLAQPEAYREALIPADVPAIAVEASSATSFYRLVGRDGLIVGVEGFGVSAPTRDLAEHFGFTVDKLGQKIREHLGN